MNLKCVMQTVADSIIIISVTGRIFVHVSIPRQNKSTWFFCIRNIKNKNAMQVNFHLYLSHKSTSTCRIIRGIIDTSESFKKVIFLVIVSHCKNVKNVFYYRTLWYCFTIAELSDWWWIFEASIFMLHGIILIPLMWQLPLFLFKVSIQEIPSNRIECGTSWCYWQANADQTKDSSCVEHSTDQIESWNTNGRYKIY